MIDVLPRLFEFQDRILDAVRNALAGATTDQLGRAARDGCGAEDVVFGIDVPAEDVLLDACAEWGRHQSFVLLAEGIEPEGRHFGGAAPQFRVIVDPVDGSRGLMHDKRSAWSLAAVAEDHGAATRMRHVIAAVMTELPTTRQGFVDRLWARRDGPAQGERRNLFTGERLPLRVAPSQATTLRHGFATVCDFFPGGKEVLGRLAERILQTELGGWDPQKAEVFSDQYISSGGQLAELMLGRDRFVLDVRPWIYHSLGVTSSLCCRPYDLCTSLIASRAGVVVREPDGAPFDPPLDVSTNVAFAGYANAALADRMTPIVAAALDELDLRRPPR
ncbi:MAG: inositol monophosphatase [Planctomycetes bacterium]|nr:inositol monophosphatase [Planctomycetota bacterium]MCB9870330.1 inositol monophosphatase [Planctomycetota bacterium]